MILSLQCFNKGKRKMKKRIFLVLLACILFFTLACLHVNLSVNVNPTAMFSPTKTFVATNTPDKQPSLTLSDSQASAGLQTWCLSWSPSYCLRFDSTLWELGLNSRGDAESVNLYAPDCRISEQGPMSMPDDITKEFIGMIEYTMVDRLYTSPPFMDFTALNNPDPVTQNSPLFLCTLACPIILYANL